MLTTLATTNEVYKTMLLPSIEKGGYHKLNDTKIGTRPNGNFHRVGYILKKAQDLFPVVLRWQQVNGTAEQKLPYEMLCLIESIQQRPQYTKVYVVLGGPGWTLRDYYLSQRFREQLNIPDRIKIMTVETFIKQVNQSKL